MRILRLTRPNDTLININSAEIIHFAPVPTSGPSMGPLIEGTRIVFRNKTHQDVKELIDEVAKLFEAAEPEAARHA